MSKLAMMVLLSGRLLARSLLLIATFGNIDGSRCVRLLVGNSFYAHWSRVKVFLR